MGSCGVLDAAVNVYSFVSIQIVKTELSVFLAVEDLVMSRKCLRKTNPEA